MNEKSANRENPSIPLGLARMLQGQGAEPCFRRLPGTNPHANDATPLNRSMLRYPLVDNRGIDLFNREARVFCLTADVKPRTTLDQTHFERIGAVACPQCLSKCRRFTLTLRYSELASWSRLGESCDEQQAAGSHDPESRATMSRATSDDNTSTFPEFTA